MDEEPLLGTDGFLNGKSRTSAHKRMSFDQPVRLRTKWESNLTDIHQNHVFLDHLGEGSSAKVYKVLDRQDGLIKALKIVPTHKNSSLDFTSCRGFSH